MTAGRERIPATHPASGWPSSAADLGAAPTGGFGAILGLLMGPSALGVTAAAVAIPEAASSLGASPVRVAWALSVYIVCLALSSAIGGRMLSVVGGRVVLRAGSTLVAVGAGCALMAPTVAALTMGRAILAVGSGLLAGLALGLAGLTPADRRPQVLSVFAALMAAFVGIGPILGGLLAPWSWQLAFASPVLSLVAVPVASHPAAAAARREGSTIDLPGLLWSVLAGGGLIVLMQTAASGGDGSVLAVLAAVTSVGVVLSARRVGSHPDGFLPRSVVGRRDLAGWWIAGLGAQAGHVAALVIAPVVLATGHGWSAPTIGIWLAVASLGGVWSSQFVAKQVAEPSGVRVGAALVLLLTAVLAVTSVTAHPMLLVASCLLGFSAFSAIQVAATYHVSERVPPDVTAAATGILSLAFLVGGAIGSSLSSLGATWIGFDDAGAIVAAPPLAAALAAFLLSSQLERTPGRPGS